MTDDCGVRWWRALAWVGSIAVGSVTVLLAGGTTGVDSSRFVAAGKTLLSSHWTDAFASKYIQAGPLQLALFGSIGRSGAVLAVVLAATTSLFVLAAGQAVGLKSPALLAVLGLLAVYFGFTRVGYEWGHPADAVTPLVWILAAVSARRGRHLQAGVMLALSVGFETWGILGVAALALAPRWRDAARAAVVAMALATLLFLPFVLGGHFAMFEYHWPVRHPSFISLFFANGATFGWPLRLLQGTVAVSTGVAAARLLHQSSHAPWVVPLAVVAARLVLDPLFLPYYRAAVEGPVLVGVIFLASRLVTLRVSGTLFARANPSPSS